MKKLIDFIIHKYDIFMYHRAYKSICRICENNAGFGYLIQLTITDWVDKNPYLTMEMKVLAEKFYNGCREIKE